MDNGIPVALAPIDRRIPLQVYKDIRIEEGGRDQGETLSSSSWLG
jgi:hypothetical protein